MLFNSELVNENKAAFKEKLEACVNNSELICMIDTHQHCWCFAIVTTRSDIFHKAEEKHETFCLHHLKPLLALFEHS